MNDTEPILTTVMRLLGASRGKLPEIAMASGVPYHTLVKIAQGTVTDPRVSTVQRLMDHFAKQERQLAEGMDHA